eukprot:CAMPEP_0171916826 /NCGR_PEP_ID=MMETSP0993-20121228/15312_1 /TAXON_ID=483369 /ORGANISM="non described non described, Strain CCMP2098" /LENGTH=376 /DNA_ID=CAMNT_0012552405 /DNA_START=86 /DNA_END=1216 /DNA_ORIENTATION=-
MTAMLAPAPRTALEFYSGIGGMRAALHLAKPDWSIVEAYDVNNVANAVYANNWDGSPPQCKSIENLPAAKIDGVAELWVMSPPCQPFCAIGKQGDDSDPRSSSFLKLVEVLPSLVRPPRFLFLENVPNFQGSLCHSRLLAALQKSGFSFCYEAVLSPHDTVGLPNTRSRFFLMASRDGGPSSEALATATEACMTARPLHEILLHPKEFSELGGCGGSMEELELSPAKLERFSYVKFDVATPHSTITMAVTKGYGKQMGKSGPVLDTQAWLDYFRAAEHAATSAVGDTASSTHPPPPPPSPAVRFRCVPSGERVRWFAPRELLRLQGFPETFEFPSTTTTRQAFSLIGNSITVPLVAKLLSVLLSTADQNTGWGNHE